MITIGQAQSYRGYRLQRTSKGVEIWHREELITIEATQSEAERVIDDWMWAK